MSKNREPAGGGRSRHEGLRRATVERLPLYLRAVEELGPGNGSTVSSEQLAKSIGQSGDSVRRDLWDLGVKGIRGIGYDVAYLHHRLAAALGMEGRARLAIAGLGNVGSALAGYSNLEARGFCVTALFDVDPEKIGTWHCGAQVRAPEQIESTCRGVIDIAVIATPATAAQYCVDAFVRAGVKALLNFAPTQLRVPAGVSFRQVDLIAELQVLQYLLLSAGTDAGPVPLLGRPSGG